MARRKAEFLNTSLKKRPFSQFDLIKSKNIATASISYPSARNPYGCISNYHVHILLLTYQALSLHIRELGNIRFHLKVQVVRL